MRIILGIDPGSRVTGYGLIAQVKQKLTYLDSGCIRMTTSVMGERLVQIYEGIHALMTQYAPHEVAIEEVFVKRNPASALKLGQARGAAWVAAAAHQVPVYEYATRQVKLALVGYGAAEKGQVSLMVMRLLSLTRAPQIDAGDALAIAICHAHSQKG